MSRRGNARSAGYMDAVLAQQREREVLGTTVVQRQIGWSRWVLERQRIAEKDAHSRDGRADGSKGYRWGKKSSKVVKREKRNTRQHRALLLLRCRMGRWCRDREKEDGAAMKGGRRRASELVHVSTRHERMVRQRKSQEALNRQVKRPDRTRFSAAAAAAALLNAGGSQSKSKGGEA